MPLSIVVFDNPAPDEATPILSTSDPTIIGELRRLLNSASRLRIQGALCPFARRRRLLGRRCRNRERGYEADGVRCPDHGKGGLIWGASGLDRTSDCL
jgi:hypothetical protein